MLNDPILIAELQNVSSIFPIQIAGDDISHLTWETDWCKTEELIPNAYKAHEEILRREQEWLKGGNFFEQAVKGAGDFLSGGFVTKTVEARNSWINNDSVNATMVKQEFGEVLSAYKNMAQSAQLGENSSTFEG